MTMETPPKYALPMIASTSTVALISVPGGEGGIAAGTFIETMTFCCAAGPSVNAAGTTVTQRTTGTAAARLSTRVDAQRSTQLQSRLLKAAVPPLSYTRRGW